MAALALSRPARLAMQRFLAFHAELVEVKRLAATMTADGPQPAPADGEPATSAASRLDVTDLFLRLRVAICPEGTPPASADGLPDIGYVMAALADEEMLHEVEWPGREQWMGTLLETALYRSRVSGEEIFTLARGIIDGTVVGRSDLAVAILLALSLGFRGRWRGADDRGAIDELRRQLYEQVYRQPPRGIDWHAAMPDAAGTVLEGGRLRRVPRLAPWLAAMALSLMVTVVAGHVIWRKAAQPLLALAADINLLGSRF